MRITGRRNRNKRNSDK
jgi:hypothetical protein